MADKGADTADSHLASDVADKSLNDPSKTSEAADDLADGAHDNDDDDDDDDDDGKDDGVTEGGAAAEGTTALKKKKKPKKKKKKASTDAAAAEPTPTASSALQNKAIQVQDINQLLKQLAASGPSKKEGKAQEDYKFWNTQPVPKFKEPNLLQTTQGDEPEGPILPAEICKASAKAEPEKLVDGFEWALIDLDDSEDLQEFYDLLYNHYVEDTDGSFRFNYSTKFLSWALKPPGWKKEWHIGVRTKTQDGKKGKLVASIAGIPVVLRVRGQKIDSVEINFLAIHRKLRNKRLAPVLIKEVTRRCYLNGIYQALYTAGTLLPTPVSTCRYFHRSLDWEHLFNTGFSHMPNNSSVMRQRIKYKLETQTSLKGLRAMTPDDIPAVKDLLVRYTERFYLRQDFTDEDIAHWICSDVSKDVVYSYVVEENGKITDFVSYYLLESTVLRSQKKETIRAAYLYYYATEAAFSKSSKTKAKEIQETLQARLQQLIRDALILAKKDDFHVFNALTLLDNPLFLKEQKFEPGDGKLHYYLFNWRTAPLPGGIDAGNNIDASKMGGVGVVML